MPKRLRRKIFLPAYLPFAFEPCLHFTYHRHGHDHSRYGVIRNAAPRLYYRHRCRSRRLGARVIDGSSSDTDHRSSRRPARSPMRAAILSRVTRPLRRARAAGISSGLRFVDCHSINHYRVLGLRRRCRNVRTESIAISFGRALSLDALAASEALSDGR